MKETGILYGVGVGPGDPELMTLKACRLIRENEVIAVPGEIPQDTVAYKIAVQAVPELKDKTLLPIYMPMTHDLDEQKRNHEKGANDLIFWLNKGKNVIFLTLGDPTIYSTFSYLQRIVEKSGYSTALVSGITSFCAAAARMNLPLAEWQEPLHIIPAVHRLDTKLDQDGNYILMKSGKKMNQVKQILKDSHHRVVMVENCGMENEHIYNSLDEIPDDAGYYSLIIAKESSEKE
ncbi:MAG: precorrin-2 C(20)-methyltransferase [Clostridiales bacterium]|nr:precorrin-2 C(20)-methyltransferase [Clostridiales bacterium]